MPKIKKKLKDVTFGELVTICNHFVLCGKCPFNAIRLTHGGRPCDTSELTDKDLEKVIEYEY